jgi:hypothetical protein
MALAPEVDVFQRIEDWKRKRINGTLYGVKFEEHGWTKGFATREGVITIPQMTIVGITITISRRQKFS